MVDSPRVVDLYFDFISPYSWLALARAEVFAREHQVEFRLHPVVYAVLLNQRGLIGPAEEPVKRRYTFVDVLRAARAAGRPLVGPPVHPFRSLAALRLVTSVLGDPGLAMRLAVDLSVACWQEGCDLADLEVLAALAPRSGLAASDVTTRIEAGEVKAALRESTDQALAAGVFGVPTFAYSGELFWGHDRMDALADVLQGRADSIDVHELDELLRRPSGVDRRGQA